MGLNFSRKIVFFIILSGLPFLLSYQLAEGYYSSGGSSSSSEFSTVVSTEKESYSANDEIVVSGEVSKYDEGRTMKFVIFSPTNSLVMTIKGIEVNPDGTFSHTIQTNEKFDRDGTYEIRAMYGSKDMKVGKSFFNFESIPSGQSEIDVQSDADFVIPDWIRTNAGWWASDSITQNDFVQGIQFLIKEKIILIPEPTTTSDQPTTQEVPEWIKNNADWWAQGLISDNEFVNAIQFLIINNIIKV